MVDGSNAKPETIRLLLENQPHLRLAYETQLNSPELLDLRPQLALTKALVKHYINEEGTKTWRRPLSAGRPSQITAAVPP